MNYSMGCSTRISAGSERERERERVRQIDRETERDKETERHSREVDEYIKGISYINRFILNNHMYSLLDIIV